MKHESQKVRTVINDQSNQNIIFRSKIVKARATSVKLIIYSKDLNVDFQMRMLRDYVFMYCYTNLKRGQTRYLDAPRPLKCRLIDGY